MIEREEGHVRCMMLAMAKRKVASSVKRGSKTPRRVKAETRVYKSHVAADAADRAYWMAQTPARRLRELERLRQLNFNYGEGKPPLRIQRVLRVAKLGEG